MGILPENEPSGLTVLPAPLIVSVTVDVLVILPEIKTESAVRTAPSIGEKSVRAGGRLLRCTRNNDAAFVSRERSCRSTVLLTIWCAASAAKNQSPGHTA